VSAVLASLEPLAEIVEAHEADRGGGQSNAEGPYIDNVIQRRGEGPLGHAAARELAHQQVRVKQEDDKGDLDDGRPDGRQLGALRWSCHFPHHSGDADPVASERGTSSIGC